MHKESGFTLVELLVTVVIVGILAAMSVEAFSTYKEQANDNAAKRQVWDASVAIEAFIASNQNYSGINQLAISPSGVVTNGPLSTYLPGFVHTPGVSLNAIISKVGNNTVSYGANAGHCNGSVDPGSPEGYGSFVKKYSYSSFFPGEGVHYSQELVLAKGACS